MKHFPHANQAFSLAELMITLVIVSILFALGLSGMKALSGRASSVQCLTNLRNLHAATMACAADWQGQLPMDRTNKSTALSWYMPLRDYLPHPGFNKSLPPYFCPANRRLSTTGGNAGWTNYAVNGNLYDGAANTGGVPSGSSPEETDAYLSRRQGIRLSSLKSDVILYLDARNATGGSWYTVAGARWGNKWVDTYPVHGEQINIIFLNGHARSVTVSPRSVNANNDLNELRADWFWPVRY